MGVIGQLLGTETRVQFIQNDKTVISIDASLKETHSRKSTPSKFPIEDGRSIADNIVTEPFKLEILGVISDTPLDAIQELLTTAASAVLPPLGVIAGSILYSALSGSTKRSVSAYIQLLDLQDRKLPMSVITSLKRYESMFITNISVPREAKTGNSIEFTVTLEQLIIVKTQTVTMAKFKDVPSGNIGADKSHVGKQDTKNAFVESLKSGQADVRSTFGIVGKAP